MATRMKPKLVVENDDYEADAVVSTSGMSWDKASERYEEIEYLEFMERLQFNRKLVSLAFGRLPPGCVESGP